MLWPSAGFMSLERNVTSRAASTTSCVAERGGERGVFWGFGALISNELLSDVREGGRYELSVCPYASQVGKSDKRNVCCVQARDRLPAYQHSGVSSHPPSFPFQALYCAPPPPFSTTGKATQAAPGSS
jgi:hypothetical protein